MGRLFAPAKQLADMNARARAASETVTPGSKDAATSGSFSAKRSLPAALHWQSNGMPG
jgi:hypothetical protein